MSAAIILHPRAKECIGTAILRFNAIGYALRNRIGSKYIHVVPMVKPRVSPAHATLTWLEELQK